jgi:hypothetical protein
VGISPRGSLQLVVQHLGPGLQEQVRHSKRPVHPAVAAYGIANVEQIVGYSFGNDTGQAGVQTI